MGCSETLHKIAIIVNEKNKQHKITKSTELIECCSPYIPLFKEELLINRTQIDIQKKTVEENISQEGFKRQFSLQNDVYNV